MSTKKPRKLFKVGELSNSNSSKKDDKETEIYSEQQKNSNTNSTFKVTNMVSETPTIDSKNEGLTHKNISSGFLQDLNIESNIPGQNLDNQEKKNISMLEDFELLDIENEICRFQINESLKDTSKDQFPELLNEYKKDSHSIRNKKGHKEVVLENKSSAPQIFNNDANHPTNSELTVKAMREYYVPTERYYFDDDKKTFMFTLKGKLNQETHERSRSIDQNYQTLKKVFPEQASNLMEKVAIDHKKAYDELACVCLKNNTTIVELIRKQVEK